MDELDKLMNEIAKNVSTATEHANNIPSHSSQLKLQLSKTKELYSRETSIAIKQTAENLLNVIASSGKEQVDTQVIPTPFLEFKSAAQTRIASTEGILMALSCIVDNE